MSDESTAPAFPELEALRAALDAVAAGKPWGHIGGELLALIDALEKAQKAATRSEDYFEFIDAPLTRSQFVHVQNQLALAARHVAAACRLAVNKEQPGDRT